MNKQEIIDSICELNKSAKPEHLENFSVEELNSYLEYLIECDLKEILPE